EKSSLSAGKSVELEDVLQGEQALTSTLTTETSLLTRQLSESMVALEKLKMQNAVQEQEVASELPMLRCAFRKRCREGYSNAMRLVCSLSILENELGTANEAFRSASPDTPSRETAFHCMARVRAR
ncbi:MAG: hypothetical protein SGPRY_001217, partial [Prymnesium sp.]